MLGLDLVDGDGTDRLLGPKKAKRRKAALGSEPEYKTEDGEELPAWQDQSAIPEMHADNNARNSRRSILSSGSTRSLKSGGRSSSNSSHTSNASSRYVWLYIHKLMLIHTKLSFNGFAWCICSYMVESSQV